MKIALPATGIALLIAGTVWFFQGINILPGSFMTGDPFWAWTGIVFFVLGLLVLFFGMGRRATK
jgi:hypothetical protein